MSVTPAYRNYWERKRLATAPVPYFPVRRWWPTDRLCEIEEIYFEIIENTRTLLDVGAGDLRIMKKLCTAGYAGEYHTLDIGNEFEYTYRDLAKVKQSYPAILLLDVLEHLNLSDGLALLDRLVGLLEPGGVLVVQTPNARCIRHPLSWDMTHLHCYNLADMWTFLTASGLSVTGYRVVFGEAQPSLRKRCRFWLSAYFITRWLGCDYADNIVAIARKPV